jgi:hypothetical protein
MSLIGECHNIKAGEQFTGAAPAGEDDLESGVLTYLESDAGGLFTLPVNRYQSIVTMILLQRVMSGL